MLLPILMICACDNTKTYVVGEDANCIGLADTDMEPVFCKDKKDKPINGIVKQYYESGSLWREMTIKDGRENGVEREYYENGTLHVIANVKNGKTEGLSQLYNEDGKLHMELNWHDGEVESAKVYDNDGNEIQTIINL